MRKLLLTAIAVFALSTMNAQEAKIGLHAGYPFGSIGENFNALVGLDLAYTFEIGESLDLGLTTGYGYFPGKDLNESSTNDEFHLNGSDFGYIPIAATGKYAFGYDDNWFAGLDLGYAIAMGSEDVEDLGGFYNVIKFGWQNEMIEVFALYQGIGSSETKSSTSGNLTTSTTSAQLATAGLGVAYKF